MRLVQTSKDSIMIKFPKKYLQASVLCLLSIAVKSLNYASNPTYLSSAPSTISETNTDLEANKTSSVESGRKIESPITNPLTFPQSRGGKNLNLTLATETSRSGKEQPRILNNPDWYPNNSVSDHSFKKVPSISPNPPLLQDNSYKWIAPLDKNTHISSDNVPYNHAPKIFSIKDIDSFYSPQRVRETDIVQQSYGQVLPFPAPQKLRTFTDVPISYILRKNYNSNYRQNIPPKLHQATSSGYYFPPPRHETNANWPCFCVPYYLCKNGVINSGGRSVAALRRRSRSLEYGARNTTQYPVLVQPKTMNAYIVEQESDQGQCEGQKVCCRPSFADDVPYNNVPDDRYYPVATPRPQQPERYYPYPPRFSDREKEHQTCGIRRAYGIQARLRHLQYAADVSEFAEYPWQIAILRKTEGQKSLYLCGGVLISYQWVATAAHCVKNEQYSPLLIRLGEWDVNRRDEIYPFVEIEVDSIIVHPEFNPETLYNDLALVRMITPVDPRLPHVTPICLPDRETLYNEQRCWVSGWGKDFFGPQGEYQSVLKEVDVPVIMQDICSLELRKTHLGPNFHLHPGFLCAGGEPGKDACTGDGGSPLVCRSGQNWYVVGLVSWGIGCGQPGIPGIYVNILYYIDWIHSIVGR